ncbi:MAG: hypothetical protein JWM34_93 [Ilumatobacteraceae bacterium]|nr:hypothetical protein [Ilumatobacteraceae bacterium]
MKKITATRPTTRFAVGGALAIAIGLGSALSIAHAGNVGASAPSSLVTITPCRLVDTRADSTVGNRSTPLTATEVADFAVRGTNGNCTIPADATGIVSNVTVVNGTSASYLTVYPGDAPQPLSSNLNWTASSAPVPNLVTVGLSATGGIKAYNNAGKADVVIDIVGYYEAGSAGAAGPMGLPGPAAVIPSAITSGKTVTGYEAFDYDVISAGTRDFIVHLPAKAGVSLTDDTVNFANSMTVITPENDILCTGTYQAPTAPAGRVCLYIGVNQAKDVVNAFAVPVAALNDSAFDVGIASGPGENYVTMTWAYTAP